MSISFFNGYFQEKWTCSVSSDLVFTAFRLPGQVTDDVVYYTLGWFCLVKRANSILKGQGASCNFVRSYWRFPR